MSRIVITGYRNPLRGDDGVGWIAAERIGELLKDCQVAALVVHQLTPDLAEAASRV